MIKLPEDKKIHIWNCLIFNYISCLLAANTDDIVVRVLFLSLIDLVDDDDKFTSEYKKYIYNSIPDSFYQTDVDNMTKEMQQIRATVARKYPNTPSIIQRLKHIRQKCRTDAMSPRNPKIWGPTMWSLLHWLSLRYTKKNSKKIEALVYRIIENLPCSICVSHASEYLQKHKIPIDKGYKAVYEYFFLFHNAVNKQTKKQIQTKKNMLSKITQTCMENIEN